MMTSFSVTISDGNAVEKAFMKRSWPTRSCKRAPGSQFNPSRPRRNHTTTAVVRRAPLSSRMREV